MSRLGDTPVLAAAVLAGILAGLLAQYRRQVAGAPMVLGGGTAAWVTIGFLIARRAASGRPTLDGGVWGAAAAALYLLSWLVAYHGLFAIRESAGIGAAWLEMRSWTIALAPASFFVGFVASRSLRPGRLGDVCLALPLVWSLPEIVSFAERGWAYGLGAGLPTLALALAPLALSRDRRVSMVTFVSAALVGGAIAWIAFSSAGVGM